MKRMRTLALLAALCLPWAAAGEAASGGAAGLDRMKSLVGQSQGKTSAGE